MLNLGVGGYSLRDEALVLEYKGIVWNPDLVVVGYVLNDPEIDPIQPLQSYFNNPKWWHYSNTLRLISGVKRSWHIKKLGEGDYYKYLHSPKQKKWQTVVDPFRKIYIITKDQNIPVLVLIFPMTFNFPWEYYPYRHLHQQVVNIVNEIGLHVVDLYPYFSQYSSKELMVSPIGHHPSTLGHRVAADAIYQWIVANNDLFDFVPEGRK